MGLVQSQTPMMQQFNAIKKRHMDAVLFFRAGDFYEMFGDDAILASELLGITLTTRHKNTANPVPMCGVPYHAVRQYIVKLTHQGHKVALVEQLETPKEVVKGEIVKRAVVRVDTPGTVLAEGADDTQSLYVMALNIGAANQGVGMAMADLSTGEVLYAQFKADEADAWLDLCAIQRPREVLLAWPTQPKQRLALVQCAEEALLQKLKTELHLPLNVERLRPEQFDQAAANASLQQCYQVMDLSGFGVHETPLALAAMGALFQYLKETQKSLLQHFHPPKRLYTRNALWLDETALADLEIVESRHGSAKDTLFGVLNYSKTAMGGRLLKHWLSFPLLKGKQIEERFNALAELIAQGEVRNAMRHAFAKVRDLERMIGRVALPQVGVAELVALRQAMAGVADLIPLLKGWKGSLLQAITQQYHPLSEVGDHLERYYKQNPLLKRSEGGYIADGVLPELDSLRTLQTDSRQVLAKLESDEQQRTGIPSLKIRYNRAFGYYIEIPRTQAHKAPSNYRRKQTLVNAERYVSTELEALEEKLLSAAEEIITLEQAQFEKTHLILQGYMRKMQQTARCIAQLDVLCALAEAAIRHNYVRPTLLADDLPAEIHIEEGRHVVLENTSMKDSFVPNSVHLNTQKQRIILITGPNMAGKSTIMRQTALIQIMAQAGCFVPAKAAKVSILKRIFTRVGAQDNLVRGQSTFMLEMSEAANILHHATNRCLVLLDEIGRGTSTYDGISIAWAMVEHLHSQGVLTLFATHYHELSQLSNSLAALQNHSLSAEEQGEHILFTRKLQLGSADKSYGIQVAKMAGVPATVITRAQEVLARLLHEQPLQHTHITPSNTAEHPKEQLSLLGSTDRWGSLSAELDALSLNTMTPLDAWLWLQKLQQRSKA